MNKSSLRIDYLARREAVSKESRAAVAEKIAEQVLPLIPKHSIVGAYMPMRSEVDSLPLIAALHAAHHGIALPCIDTPGAPLIFRYYEPGDVLITGRYNTREPAPHSARAEPDVLIIPLLAFDRRGHRLGYGAGYYDRTLQALRVKKTIGIAFAVQEHPGLPADAHDRRVEYVVTEKEVIRCVE